MTGYINFIEVYPEIMVGKPVMKGTRLTIELILEELSGGTKEEDLLQAYPRLTQKAIWTALEFAADALKGERSYLIE